MASLNKVLLIGNLGKDPEVRYTTSGTAVASFSLATTERFKNRNGEMEERTEWHNVVLWGKQAETAKDHLAKGKSVFIEGRLQTRKWQDKDGKDRWTTEVVGDRMQFVGPKGGESAGGRRSSSTPDETYSTPYDEPSINSDDDIPF